MEQKIPKTGILVDEVMSRNVIKIRHDQTIDEAALLMKKQQVGSLIVIDEKDNPIGIITDRDIVVRVLAKKLDPSKTKVKDVMSKPLFTVNSKTDIGEIALKMRKYRVRRFGVIEKGKLIGIITDRNIFAITPEILELTSEKAKLLAEAEEMEESLAPPESSTGYCDECEEWSDNLKYVNGRYLCEDCRSREEFE